MKGTRYEMHLDIPTIVASLGILGVLVGAGLGIARFVWWLSAEFQNVSEHMRAEMTKHELLDMQRHVDNVQRLTRLEKAVNGNGGGGHG